jgi:FkbM family methyltransferase
MQLGHRWQHFVLMAKRIWYGARGEPIAYGPHRLRYLPGSRPVRLKYAASRDSVARNDARQIQFFLDHVRSGDVVFDIGGHYGEYAVLFAALVGRAGHVVSFEPDIAARPILKANLALNDFTDRVRVEEYAVFDRAEEQLFYTRNGNAQSSLARTGLGGSASDADVACYPITTVRLDEYVQRAGNRTPNVIKLDVEGAEFHTLKGAGDLLRSNILIVCELHPYTWKEFESPFEEFLRLIHDSGRSVRYLDENLRIEDGPHYAAVVIS